MRWWLYHNGDDHIRFKQWGLSSTTNDCFGICWQLTACDLYNHQAVGHPRRNDWEYLLLFYGSLALRLYQQTVNLHGVRSFLALDNQYFKSMSGFKHDIYCNASHR